MKPLRLLGVIALSVLAVGCGDDDAPTQPSAPAQAQLRVAHLSPDAPNVDVRLDGTIVLSNVPYGLVSNYLPVAAGSHRITVTPAGATAPVVIDATATLAANSAYTVAATGRLAAIQPLVLTDDRATSSSGAKVRFVHTGPDAPAVDVAVTNGPVLFGNVAFRGTAGPAAVNAGSYDLEVRVAGTATVALRVPGVSFAAGRNYTVFAIGLLANESLTALPAVDAP